MLVIHIESWDRTDFLFLFQYFCCFCLENFLHEDLCVVNKPFEYFKDLSDQIFLLKRYLNDFGKS